MIAIANQSEVAVHCTGEREVVIRFWTIHRWLEVIPTAIATDQEYRENY